MIPMETTPMPTKLHPGFRALEMTALIVIDPDEAKKRILAAYRSAGASLREAATYLAEEGGKPPTERTLHRWVDKLGLRGEMDEITKRAHKEGWLNEARRPEGLVTAEPKPSKKRARKTSAAARARA
jgi:hypothetical protein